MSTTIDERVVSMQFDNKHFETNVRTSLGTLDKLKQSLRLTEASKGLENVSSAAKKFDMSGMSNAVENVRLKFSALEVMAVTTLANITNSAVNAGKRIAAAFTIEPIRTGLAEYETQINSVQTILANTESKGTTLDDVNAALDTLNKYADKTIYNFTEMTRNIGTFTAAGIDLDTSVNAIQGIANLAAVSGSNAQQASTAMYQLSQALASGTVKLMDWNSVVNAGMGGQVFQDALKETARVHGVEIDKMIKKQGSFRETLQEGWLTSEILTETLQKFTLTTEGLTKEQIEANKQMLKAKGYTDDQIESIFKLGETATNAATKVKTFTQLMDTLKEAAQSGWTQTWELIIGDFDQAKELWTNVSDVFGEMINKSAESRNTLLEGALTSNWDKLIKQLNEAGIQTSDFQKSVSETAEKHGKNLDELIKKYGSFEKAVRSGAISTDILKESLKGVGKSFSKETLSLDLIKGPLKRGSRGNDVQQLEAALKSLGYDLVGKNDKKDYSGDGRYGTLTEAAVKDFQKKQGLKVTGVVDEKTLEALRKATISTAEEVGNLNESIFDLIDGVDELGGREMLLESFKNIFRGILSIIAPIKSAFRNIFPPITVEQLYSAIEGFKNITEKFKLSQKQANRLRRTFKGLFAALDIVKTIVVGALGAGFKVLSKVFTVVGDKVLIVTAKIGDAIVKFRNWLFENDRLTKGFSTFINILKTVASAVKNAVKAFLEIPGVQKAIEKVKKAFSDAFGNVGDYFGEGIARIKDFAKRLMSMDSISLDNLSSIFKDFKENVIDYFFKFDFKGMFDNIKNALKGFKDSALKNLDGAGEKFAWLKEKLLDFVNFIRSKIPAAIAILMGVMLIKAVSGLGKTIQTIAEAFSGFSESITGFIDTVGKSISKFANAKAFEAKTKGILNLAKAIGILAVSIAVLTFLDQKKMWSAVGALAALAVVLGALSFVSGKIGGTLDFGKSSASIILLAGALFILVTCLNDLEKLNGDNLLRDIAILGGMAIGLAVVAGILGKVAPQLSANSFVFIALAAGIKIMVSALTDIDKMKFDNIGRTIGVLLGVVAGLALIAVVSSKISLGSTVGIIAIAIGLKVLIGAMEDISNLNAEKMKNNIGSFITIFGALAVLIVASKFAGKYAASAGIAILAISAALILIVGAIRILGTMDQSIANKATTSIAKILLVFVAFTALSNFAGKNAIAAGIGILAMSAAILILIGAIYLLKDIDPSGLDRAIDAIGKISLMFALLIASTSLAQNCVGTLVVLTVAVAVLSAAIVGLSFIDPSGLKNATMALGAVIAMFALLVASTHFVKGGIGALIVMTGAVVILAGILYLLSDLPIESSLAIAASLSVLILSLSASCMLLSMVPVTAALTGVVSLAAFIAGVGLIMAAISGLNALCPELNTFLSESLPTLELIGSGIGSFFGGIVGGFGEAVASSFPQIGTDLSTFMTNLQPFIDGAKNIDASVADGVGAIVGVITSLTAANILDGIASFITGESSLTAFATELPLFGEGLKGFSDSVTGIDTAAIDAATSAATKLSDMAATIPNEGGLIAKFAGENSIGSFGTQLPLFGQGLKGFADNVSGIDTASVTAAATASEKLAAMADLIPNEGGFIAKFSGENSIGSFGTQLPLFGQGLKGFADNVSGIKTETVTAAATAAESLANMATLIPNEGGLLGLFAGENSIGSFGTQLPLFGQGLKGFADNVSGINTESVTAAATAAEKLAAMAALIPNEGGLFSLFTGDNSMETFGKELKKFGEGLKGFADNVVGIDTASVTAASTAAKDLAEMANLIPNQGGLFSLFTGDNSMETFGNELEKFGKGMAKFSKSVADINIEAVGAATTVASRMTLLANRIPEGGYTTLEDFGSQLSDFGSDISDFSTNLGDTSSLTTAASNVSTLVTELITACSADLSKLKTFSTSLEELGKGGVDGFVKALRDGKSKASKASNEMFASVLESASKSKDTFIKIVKEMGSKAVSAIRDKYGDFKSAGKYVAEGLAKGIADKRWMSEDQAARLARAAIEAAKRELGVASPSKEFYKIGGFTGLGFVNALSDYIPKAYRVSSEVGSSARKGLSNAVSKISDVIQNGIDTQPTIRPVVDLSGVATGANAINGMFRMSPSLSANVGSISAMMNRNQNGVSNADVVSAIKDLGKKIGMMSGDTYSVNGVTYDDGSNVSNAVRDLTRAIKMERRV